MPERLEGTVTATYPHVTIQTVSKDLYFTKEKGVEVDHNLRTFKIGDTVKFTPEDRNQAVNIEFTN